MPASPAVLLNPLLLGLGIAAAAVPIIIHLLNRRRVQPIPWAAMRWLMAAIKRHQRRLRLENWLILALRVAAILLLGLALARPVVTDPALAGVLASKRSVYLVLDTSYSLQAKRGARSVEDVMKAEADAILSGLGSEDTVAIVVTNDPRLEASDGRRPFVLLPRTVAADATTRAKEAVATLRTRDAPADWAGTLESVLGQLAEEDVNRLLVVVTDLQARDWDARGGAADPIGRALERFAGLDTAVRIVDVGPDDRSNLVVADVASTMRRDAFVGRPLRLAVTVENHGPEPVDGAKLAFTLDGDATPVRRVTVGELPALDAATGVPGTETVTVDLPGRLLDRPGSHQVQVEIAPPSGMPAADGLGLDSRRHMAFVVRDRIRVLAWVRSSQDASLPAESYLRAIYERYETDEEGRRTERNPLYELDAVTTEGALVDRLARRGGEPVDLVVLANTAPRGESIAALRAYVRGGGALLGFVGDRVEDPAQLNDPFHADPATRLLPFPYEAATLRDRRVESEAPFLIDLETDTGHPLAAPFVDEQARAWLGLIPLATWGRMPFVEDAPPSGPAGDGATPTPGVEGSEGRVVLRFEDGQPAIVQGGLGLGRTLWVATSLDDGWFERALPFFLPVFLDEAAVYLTRPDQARRNLEVGRRILVTWLPRDAGAARFLGPRGTVLTPTRYDGTTELDRPTLLLDRTGVAGIWRLTYQREDVRGTIEETEEHFAVNPEAGEGALRRADVDLLLRRVPEGGDAAVLRSWAEVGEDPADTSQGELTRLLLWALLGLLLIESLLALLFGRRGGAARGEDGAPPRGEAAPAAGANP